MNQKGSENTRKADPWDSFEPYVQLIRSLLPRASSVALFDTKGDLRWSSETTTGPDLLNIVDDALTTARTAPDSAGQLRVLAGNLPVYLCWLRSFSRLCARVWDSASRFASTTVRRERACSTSVS